MSQDSLNLEALPRPSRAEWELLAIICELGNPTVHEARALQDSPLDYNSTYTLIQRLVAKGYLAVDRRGPRDVHYSVKVDQEAMLRLEVKRFLAQVVRSDVQNLTLVRKLVDARIKKAKAARK